MEHQLQSTSQFASENRKIRKPLLEKKRRARINECLEALKQMLLESKTNLKGSKNGQRTAKLEKADILEMTVKYMQNLHYKLQRLEETHVQKPIVQNGTYLRTQSADNPMEAVRQEVTIYPTSSVNGELVFVIPKHLNQTLPATNIDQESSIWRPW
ncbi:uncharacterized protein LOC143191332 [Rhynchophorus ferrugineus]|uniref:BHLH domain-containing protein n=1 Tax=Rhynchophorus ferrugineus TaxID=354439 RepID=A0A834IUC9_RHYFE|nr:hypothetical protein GWI33_001722 [Rhynchophorus ferrugineus]